MAAALRAALGAATQQRVGQVPILWYHGLPQNSTVAQNTAPQYRGTGTIDYSSTTVPIPRYRPHRAVVYHIGTVPWSTTSLRSHGTAAHGNTAHHRTTIPQYQAHGTDFMVPWSTTALRYRHGTATLPLRYRPHRTATLPPRHRPHGTAGTASKVLPRYRHGTTTVLPPRHRPPDTATLPRHHHGTATVPTLMVLPRDSPGTEPMVLPRCRFQGTAKVLPPRYRPPTVLISWYSQGLPLPWCCQGAATVPTIECTVTVPNLMVLPRYRHGIAPMVLPRYRPSKVLPRYRPSWYWHGTARVLPRWYCQGTASKVLRRYRYGTAAARATVTSP